MSETGEEEDPAENGGGGGRRAKRAGYWPWAIGAAALLALVFALAPSAREAAQQIPWARHRLDASWVPAAVAAQVGVYVCLAGILAAALGALGFRGVPFRSLLPTGGVFLFANRALPGPSVAGPAVLVLRLARRGVPAEAAQAVAATFYAADYAGFLLLAVIALPVLAASGRLGPLRPAILLIALALILLGGAVSVVLYLVPGLLERLAERAGRIWGRWQSRRHRGSGSGSGGGGPEAAEALAVRAREAVATFRVHVAELVRRPGSLALATLWSFLMHVCESATLVLAALVFGVPVTAGVAAAGYVAGNLGAIVSFLPGGVGLYEGGMIAALHVLGGMPLPNAVAATLLYRLLSLWLPVPFGIVLVRRIRRAEGDGPSVRS